MQDAQLIAVPAAPDEWRSFLNGSPGEGPPDPSGIAWQLETSAVARGWPSDVSLGRESDLALQFGVSRAVIREAVRILEARGSMHMRRGCRGGLRLVQSNLDAASSALATYVTACGYTREELAQTRAVVEPVLQTFDPEHVVSRVYSRTLALLSRERLAQSTSSARATTIALGFIGEHAPIPESGVYIGSGADLCDAFSTCRATFRQALRIVDDLGMLRVQRGRGGGYWLKRPSPIGVVRHVFSLLASRRQQLTDLVPAVFALNITQLRLATHRLRLLDVAARAQQCKALEPIVMLPSEPLRWAVLQQQLAQLSGCRLTHTLQRCVIAYQARLGSPVAPYETQADALRNLELGIIAALRAGDDVEAERLQRVAHHVLSRLLGCPGA